MNKIAEWSWVAVVSAGFLMIGTVWSQEKKGQDSPAEKKEAPPAASAIPPIPDMAQMQEMMKKMEAATKPGPQHKALEPFVGSWKTTLKMFFGGPSMPGAATEGTAEIKWVLDGRFLLEEYNGEITMPDMTGQMLKKPFQGLGMTGHDNHRNLYHSTWADNGNTHLLTMAGMGEPTGKTFTFYGEMDEPMMGVTGRTVKYVRRILDEQKWVLEIIDLHAGEGYRVVEVTYERK